MQIIIAVVWIIMSAAMNITFPASIKISIDLSVGKSSVRTHVYVFGTWEVHQNDSISYIRKNML